MFEHQFGRGNKSKTKNNNQGNLTIINQSINQNLPQIGNNGGNIRMDDYTTPKGNIRMPKLVMSPNHTHERPNWEYT